MCQATSRSEELCVGRSFLTAGPRPAALAIVVARRVAYHGIARGSSGGK